MNDKIKEFVKESGLEIFGLGAKKVMWDSAIERFVELIRTNGAGQPAQKCSYPYCGCNSKAWCKVERNEALNKKAENARELGLMPYDGGDYEPAQQEPNTKHTEPFESARVGDYNRGWNDCLFASGIVKQTEQPAQQEPVAYWIPKAEQFCIAGPTGRPFAKAWEPFYTRPQERVWVDLTDEEILQEFHPLHATGLQFARAVLAKLKEKNT